MDLGQLQAFLKVAERRSFTLAAQDLNLSQSGLSRQIQKLEREVGVPLLVRARGGAHLTEAGERYLAFAEATLTHHQEVMTSILGTGALEGELRIAASTTPAEFLLPRLIADFTALHPKVQAIVFTTDSQRVAEEVREGRRDIGFAGARFARSGLRFDPVAEDEIVLLAPSGHPFASRSEVRVEELANHRFIQREAGSGTMESVRAALAARGMTLPPHHVAMTLSTTAAVVSAVRWGYGLGFVSSMALAEASPQGPVPVRLAGVSLRRTLYLVRDERRLPPPAGRRFVDFVLHRAG